MFAFPAARRPLGVAASLCSALLLMSAAGPAAAADGYLGVMLQEVTPSMGKALQLGERPGVLVNSVVDDSPAAKAGLQDGDIILELNGRAATDQSALTKAVRELSPGDKANLVVLRDGRQVKLTAEVGEREAGMRWKMAQGGDEEIDIEKLRGLEGLEALEGLEGLEDLKELHGLKDLQWLEDGDTRVMVLPRGKGAAPHMFFEGDEGEGGNRRVIVRTLGGDRGWLGVHMDALNAQLGDYFGVKDGAGVLVTEVVDGSPAEKAGLRAGDVIVGAGGKDVATPDALHKALAGTKAGDELDLQVLRKGSRQSVKATLGEMPGDAGAPRHVRIFRGGDDGEGGDMKIMAPRMLRRLGRDDAGGEREVIIERRHGGGDVEDEGLDEVREEMEALREELKQLREDLKR